MNQLSKLTKLHQPSSHRVPIPAMIGDAPACTECGKAWPCPTVDILQSYTVMDTLFDYANYRMSLVWETYGGIMLRGVGVERYYSSTENGHHVELTAYWHPQWQLFVKNRYYEAPTTHIMPLHKVARSREEVDRHVTKLVRTLEDLRTGQIPAHYAVTGADRDR